MGEGNENKRCRYIGGESVWCVCEWRWGEEAQHNKEWIKENFYGRPGTLISHSCLSTDPFPAKPPHLISILTARAQQDKNSTFRADQYTHCRCFMLGSCSQFISCKNIHSKTLLDLPTSGILSDNSPAPPVAKGKWGFINPCLIGMSDIHVVTTFK